MAGERREFVFADLIQTQALEIGDGYRAKNSELGGDGPIFLRAGHVRDTHIDLEGVERFRRELAGVVAAKMSRSGDTIVTTKGNSAGRTSYVVDALPPFVYSPHLSYWRSLDAERIVPGFLRYWSRSQEFRDQLAGLAASTDMAPYLSLTDQKRLRIVLPPAAQQRGIAHILGTLDDKIELNRRMNETLEAIALALFKSWFVDFDPVRAKAKRQQTVPIDSSAAPLFSDSFEDSPLGEIPRGWGVGTVSELLSLGRDVIDPRESPVEVFDHYSIPAFDEGRVPHLEPGEQIKSNKFLVPSGCVLLSKLNPRIPRVWLPTARRERRAICSTEFLIALPRPGVLVEFLYSLLGSTSFLGVFATLVTGTSGSHQRVKPEYMLGMEALLPAPQVTVLFADIVRPLLGAVAQYTRQSQILAAIRDALLPKLLSGEVRVKDAEKFVGAAT